MTHVLTAEEAGKLLAAGRAYRASGSVRAEPVTADGDWANSQGDLLHAQAGDWWVTDGDERWVVARAVFANTYEQLEGDRYRKTATVIAVQMDQPFTVETLEGTASGGPGDWLVSNPEGECWPVVADVFTKRYEDA